MKKGILIGALLLFSKVALPCDVHGITGIVEENDLYIPTDAKGISTITEEQFNDILDRIEQIYAPIVKAKRATLQVIRKWDDGTVNAYAQQVGKTWKISMFGGLARHETITADGFALVACHELGHHLGGAPKKRSFFGGTWASNEGQADYFGNLKCMRKYMERDNNVWIARRLDVPELVKQKCRKNFSHIDEISMCERGAMAGQSLANLFAALRNQTKKPSFKTPDPAVVSRTNDNHPASQCRLDTYLAGAICHRDHYDEVSDRDETAGVCSRKQSDVDGIRPLCWFKPQS